MRSLRQLPGTIFGHYGFVERLNRRPFRLAGFGYDHSGTQVSWQGGKLEATASSPCKVRAVFSEGRGVEVEALTRQVSGREFSSGDPAMQAINPRVEKLWLAYP